jgi:hypothetical protein
VTRRVEGDGGVPHGTYLLELTEAVVKRRPDEVQALRGRGVELLGGAGFVRAIGVAAGFDGINRVANAIGIPLDDRFSSLEQAFWDGTKINEFSEGAVVRIQS